MLLCGGATPWRLLRASTRRRLSGLPPSSWESARADSSCHPVPRPNLQRRRGCAFRASFGRGPVSSFAWVNFVRPRTFFPAPSSFTISCSISRATRRAFVGLLRQASRKSALRGLRAANGVKKVRQHRRIIEHRKHFPRNIRLQQSRRSQAWSRHRNPDTVPAPH